jgi:hypothetical protein
MRSYLIYPTCVLLIAFFATACNQNPSNKQPDTSSIAIKPIMIHRYEQALFALPTDSLGIGLQKLLPEFELFIGQDFNNATSLLQMQNYLNDPGIQEGWLASDKLFRSMQKQEAALEKAFKTIKYYLNDWQQPEIYTFISGYDVENGIFMTANNLIIPLDNYLGASYKPYKQVGIPIYIIERMEPNYLIPDAIKTIATVHFTDEPLGKSLVEQMVIAGKNLYFAQQILANTPDYLLIGYNKEQMEWCKRNESEMWAFLVSQKLLFNNNKNITSKFMAEAPFTDGFPKESPGRTGHFIGWQIIESYMENHAQTTLSALMQNADYQDIFNKSNYKPKRK